MSEIDQIRAKTKLYRTFKTAWFAKAAKKAGITDADLCKAIAQVVKGQCDNLGGDTFKKCLNKNMHRQYYLRERSSPLVLRLLVCEKEPRQY